MGCFDPYSDDPRLGIQKIHLCKYSGYLTVAGTAGQVSSRTGALLLSFVYAHIIYDCYIVITTCVLNEFHSANHFSVQLFFFFFEEHRPKLESIVCTQVTQK